MVELFYAKWITYEYDGLGDEALEYSEAVKSDQEEKSIILRHVIIGPTQKAWATRELIYSSDDYDYIDPSLLLHWEKSYGFQFITRAEFDKAWQEVNGPYYTDKMIQDLAKIRYD